ncbi:MAG TPA: glutamine-synthetase adenylyltransferase [Bryobacteraceae bacterium]|nr:glutamine-synthetase adenylyltransferase [Bryobacteraceae bacterium]
MPHLQRPSGNADEREKTAEPIPDPQQLSRRIEEFSARHPAIWHDLSQDPDRMRWLRTIFNFSHFLAEELIRHPKWIWSIGEIHRARSFSDYKENLTVFLEQRGVTTPSAFELALFRRKELLRLVVRDALSLASLVEITQEISDLADALLECALTTVCHEIESRYGQPLVTDGSDRSVATFTVLALGKLGGRELNYSSDIDLMFLYSENGETSGPQRVTNKEFFKKVANQLTNLLSTYTAAGMCYRVDLRLRPEGTLGDVCISLAAAKEYYAKRARDWELQMLIKARVAAGDRAVGQALLDSVESSIYATTVDFSTIETMSEARERISEKVARRKLRKSDLDIKLTRGGIRDIEFLVQCMQRLHGSRGASVRSGSTLFALSRLHEKDLLSETEWSRLVGAYQFLRHLEHRLQIEDDRQTHTLPLNPQDLDRIARGMPAGELPSNSALAPSALLLQVLNKHLENVQGIYDRIVHAQRPLYYSPSSQSASLTETVPSRVAQMQPPLPLQKSFDSIEKSAPRLFARLRQRGVFRCDQSLADFFDRLHEQPGFLKLLDEQPQISEAVVNLFELSPFLSEQLNHRPELLEEVRRAIELPDQAWPFEALAGPLNDIDALRHFFRREMFRIQVASVCRPEPVFRTLDRTSALAEFLIARAYRIAREQAVAHARAHATPDKPFIEPQSEMMIVALGRLGMREFDLSSDADLLFIIPDSESIRQRFWTRVAEHLLDILQAYSGEGAVLSVDTRLRPNGREGMLVQTESAYVDYFSNKAEAWEGIAYMKARAVAGDPERATDFLKELQQVDWRRYGQSGRSRQDLRQMRMRLQKEQGQITPLKAGEGGYYDADFILMYLRLKGAGMFFKTLNTPERIDIVEKMGHLERADAEFLMRATTFFRALDHAVRVVTGRAEEKLPATPTERDMVRDLVHRWAVERLASDTLEGELDAFRAHMRRLFDSIFTAS